LLIHQTDAVTRGLSRYTRSSLVVIVSVVMALLGRPPTTGALRAKSGDKPIRIKMRMMRAAKTPE